MEQLADLPICVAAMYHFARHDDFEARQAPLETLCKAEGVRGTLLLAREGVNGTIAGSDEAITKVVEYIRTWGGFEDIVVKYSRAPSLPFFRMKVRLKREIVTMGQPDIDPLEGTGYYVEPQDWNALISDPDVIVIDTRNDYEVAVGTFAGAIDPETPTFRDFPEWFRQERERLMDSSKTSNGKPPRVAMFCTGGIRCEKSTAFLKAEGIDEVYHLKGGILKYLEDVPAEESLWEGECFVFDHRTTVGHGLVPGDYTLCHACRRPLDEAARTSPLYEKGVCCGECHDERTEEQRNRYRERHKQEVLAAKRGVAHIGNVLERHAGNAKH